MDLSANQKERDTVKIHLYGITESEVIENDYYLK